MSNECAALNYGFGQLWQGYLGKEVFVGSCRVMQPLNQQSKELFNGQTQAFDLVGSPTSITFWDITQALAIGVQSPICTLNKELRSNCTFSIMLD